MPITPHARAQIWVGLLAILLPTTIPLEAAAQEPKNAKWEYCEILRQFYHDTAKVQYTLTKGRERIEAVPLKELGEKLKMRAAPTHTVAVLDHLGADGWELVGYTAFATAPQLTSEVYLLKRKKR